MADDLSSIAGLEIHPRSSLAPFTTLRIGGEAEFRVEISDEGALVNVLSVVSRQDCAFHLLGMGSNLLVPDEGLAGVTGRLIGDFQVIEVGAGRVRVGAGVSLAQLARKMAVRGLLGLEAFCGFPSTVGGAVVMNAGCYGVEVVDVLVSAATIDSSGRRRVYAPADLKPGYRTTALQAADQVVTEAVFRLEAGDPEPALARIDELNRKRWSSLPSGQPNAGSIFRNPTGDHAGRLIEEAGLKGESRGMAQISPKHANVIVNLGGARAADVLELMILVHGEVQRRYGVILVPELVLAGSLRERWRIATASSAEAVV